MLVGVDVIGGAVLLAVDGGVLVSGEMPAVGRAVVAHFVVDALLLAFEVRGFPGRQLSALDALRDALLLILLALADFAAVAVVLLSGVVLFGVDSVRKVNLLIVQLRAVSSREVAIVFRTHDVLFLIDPGFLVFQILRFTGGELAALDALSDAGPCWSSLRS